jgi:zinc transport system substrate-binding protein
MREPIRILILVAAAVVCLVAAACRRGPAPTTRNANDLTIVCTFLPVYVFTLNVVGDAPGVRVEMLVARDVGCPHNYALRPADLKRVAHADLIIANGVGAEPFLDDLQKANPKARVLTIADECDVLADAEGSDGKAEPHGHADAHSHGGVNPHVWVSPIDAIKEVRTLARKLSDADPSRAERYKANSDAFVIRLETLNRRMHEVAKGFTHRQIVTFHDAFAYVARDLNLEVVATLEAEPGQEPSARRMAEIIDIVRKTHAPVFFEPASSDAIARTVAHDAGVPVYPLNPFNSLDGKPTAASYEQVMLANLDVLEKALGGRQ